MRSPTAMRTVSAPPRIALHVAAVAFLVATAGPALAAACGDNVGGTRVACACGDEVVADAVLWPTDPVVTEACSGDGLVLLAGHGAESITLHMGGQSLTGRGHGSGIRVARGGRLGAVIIGGDEGDPRAEIANFGTGIRASGRNVLREIRAVDIHDNARDGLFLRASGVTLEDVRSEGNGRDGVAISGHGNQVSGVTARDNTRDGLKVRGSTSTVDAKTIGNLRNGTVIGGRGNLLEQVHTGGNGGAGVRATGEGHDVSGVNASGNGGGNLAGRVGAVE